jgi:hypothetical protein
MLPAIGRSDAANKDEVDQRANAALSLWFPFDFLNKEYPASCA